MTEVLICLKCGETVTQCQCASTDPLARWYQIRNELVNLCKSITLECQLSVSGSNFAQLVELTEEMIKIEGCDPDCDCRICHDLGRNTWDSNYPNILDVRLNPAEMPDEIWVVDLCQRDDYRFRDCEMFTNAADASAYIESLADNPLMTSVGGPWNITPEKVRTLESALERLHENYGSDEQE